MAGFLGLLPILYLNAAIASTETGKIASPHVSHRNSGNEDYLARYPSDLLEIMRRGTSANLRKMALSVGKRFGTTRSEEVSKFLSANEGPLQADPKRRETVVPGTVGDGEKSAKGPAYQHNLPHSLKDILSPILTSDELASQIQDNPRMAKAVVDAWIDTNNDGVITGSEILGRK